MAQSINKELIVAALFALVTNWEETQTRNGRRGDYKTTGALMYRIRQLNPEEREQVDIMTGALGLDLDTHDLDEIFSGDFEYQVGFSCNRFTTIGASRSKRLTANELRTLERARSILSSKESEAAKFLTTPDSKVA